MPYLYWVFNKHEGETIVFSLKARILNPLSSKLDVLEQLLSEGMHDSLSIPYYGQEVEAVTKTIGCLDLMVAILSKEEMDHEEFKKMVQAATEAHDLFPVVLTPRGNLLKVTATFLAGLIETYEAQPVKFWSDRDIYSLDQAILSRGELYKLRHILESRYSR